MLGENVKLFRSEVKIAVFTSSHMLLSETFQPNLMFCRYISKPSVMFVEYIFKPSVMLRLSTQSNICGYTFKTSLIFVGTFSSLI